MSAPLLASNPRRLARASGYAGLIVLMVVSGLVIAGVMLAPDLVIGVKARQRAQEESMSTRLRQRLLHHIERTQAIPAPTNWSTWMLPFVGHDQTEVEQVFPGFASDANITRVFLVDPGLSGLLPFTQGVLGLTNSQTNLMASYARVMLVSNTKRSLSLPMSSGTPSSNLFHSVWNWVYNPSTKAPPSAFPGSWTDSGEFLHVQRMNLASLFYRVTMNHLLYGVGETNAADYLVSSSTTRYFLRGTRLILAQTDGTLARIHVVNRDVAFDFGGAGSGPLAWWRFVETSGSVATNSGSLGSSADGLYTGGVTLNVAGPRPPTYSGYPSNNTAAQFDGVDDYVFGTTNGLMNNFTGFTIAGWINPATASFNHQDLFGQLDLAGFGFTTAGKVELYCDNSTKKLHYFYPYSSGAWHHLAGVGDGANMYIYADGVEVASRVYATTNYGSNSNPFHIGAKSFASTNYFNGLIDEVLIYNRALSAGEISQIYGGTIPP